MKHIKEKWPEKFKDEPRSVILGLAMDGVNPFSNQISTYSYWHIFIINYNIPPWMSIRKEHLISIFIILEQK